MKITVIGGGYVGLTTGICLAYVGHDVCIVERDQAKIGLLLDGVLPIYEPGLDQVWHSCSERVVFRDHVSHEVANNDLIVIAVGTPSSSDGDVDLTDLFAAVRELRNELNPKKDYVVAIKSTVPVGTNRILSDGYSSLSQGGKVFYASNPEFLREASAVFDMLYPSRIVIGARDSFVVEVLRQCYEPILSRSFAKPEFIDTDCLEPLPQFLVMLPESAEMVKYASNAFLALKVSFVNEVAVLCEHVGADISEVTLGMGTDPRIGNKFLNAGIGWGGSCFPKDVSALIKIGKKYSVPLLTVQAGKKANDLMRQNFVEKIDSMLGGLSGKVIAVLGLAFKANTDDVRESPALDIIRKMIDKGAVIRATDPVAIPNAKKVISGTSQITYFSDPYEAINGADAIVIATPWERWRKLDFKRVSMLARSKLIFDGRNLLDCDMLRSLGFTYIGVGKPFESEMSYQRSDNE